MTSRDYRLATVVDQAQHVRLDGEASALAVTPVSLVQNQPEGSRVLVQFLGRQVFIIGAVNGGTIDATGISGLADFIADQAADTGWVPLEIQAGYKEFGTAGGYVCQIRSMNGVVHLRGLVARTSGNFAANTAYTSVAKLPAGFAIPYPMWHSASAGRGNASAEVVIGTDGYVTIQTGPTSTPAYVSLHSIGWIG